MVQAHSGHLRGRVLRAAFDGLSTRQAAIRFGVGVTPATPWLRRFSGESRGRSAAPGKPRGSRLDAHAYFILALVKAGTIRRLPSKEHRRWIQ